jgi:hypothetical protein
LLIGELMSIPEPELLRKRYSANVKSAGVMVMSNCGSMSTPPPGGSNRVTAAGQRSYDVLHRAIGLLHFFDSSNEAVARTEKISRHIDFCAITADRESRAVSEGDVLDSISA